MGRHTQWLPARFRLIFPGHSPAWSQLSHAGREVRRAVDGPELQAGSLYAYQQLETAVSLDQEHCTLLLQLQWLLPQRQQLG